MDFVGVAGDCVSLVKDLHDRFRRAPYQVAERTNYVIERNENMESHIEVLTRPLTPYQNGVSKNSEASDKKEPRHLQIIRDCQRELMPAFTDKRKRKKHRFVDLITVSKHAMRRDHIGDICADVERSQNDHHIDSVLIGTSQNLKYIQSLELTVRINPCINVSAARTLHSSPSIRIDELSEDDSDNFCSIHTVDEFSNILPVWGIGPTAPDLSADHKAMQKFSVLVSVANALVIAHSARWYHRRLSTENIFVHSSLVDNTNKRPLLDATEAVRILNFRCPITSGCFDGCSRCRKALSDAVEKPSCNIMLHCKERPNTLLFSETCIDDWLDGERVDVVSFAALTLWMFSGCKLTPTFDIFDQSNEEAISRVPWLLRFIIADRNELSIYNVFVFLQALQEGRMKPHIINRPLMSMPPTYNCATSKSSSEPDLEHILFECSSRSILSGAYTKEPQALVHLGKLQEERALSFLCGNKCSVDSPREPRYEARDTLSRAYFCFENAAKLGESSGYLQMAVLQAKCIDGTIPIFLESESISNANMLNLIFKAAVYDDIRAVEILRKVPRVGVQRAQRLFEEPTIRSSFCHNRLLQAVTEVGKCWRRGLAGLSVDHNQAQIWLRFAKDRSYPEGTLELGLLMIQTAKGHADIKEGVNLVTQVSNTCPTNAGYSACYWLGYWHHFGLVFEESQVEIVKQDNGRAESFLKSAAQGGHTEAMALYARLFRKQGKISEERKWNAEARKRGSIYAYCAYADRKAKEAVSVFQTVSVGENGRNITNLTELDDEETSDIPKKKKGISRFSVRQRTSLTGSQSSGSNTSDHFDLKSMKYKPSAVDKLLHIAISNLVLSPEKFAKDNPEASVIPLPYVMAGRIILKNLEIWAQCAPSVQNQDETIETFTQRKRREACELLYKAAQMDLSEKWRSFRVNYIKRDVEDIEKARNYLSANFPDNSLKR